MASNRPGKSAAPDATTSADPATGATTKGRISVVIPCHGQAHFLADAIESVLTQTRHADEVLVVDDGSPDDVAGVVERYPSVTILRQENRGLARARNAGLRASYGDLLVFLDADDRLLPEALSAGAEAHAAHDAVLVWGPNRPIGATGRVLGPVSNPHPVGFASYAELLTRNVVGPPVGVMFRREPLTRCGGFSDGVVAAEDYEAYLRLARRGPAFCHGRLIAEYRLHGGNMSADSERMLEGVLGALDAQAGYVAGHPALARALRDGRRQAFRLYSGAPAVEAIGAALRDRRLVRALTEAAKLLFRDPAFFFDQVLSRMRRPRPRTPRG